MAAPAPSRGASRRCARLRELRVFRLRPQAEARSARESAEWRALGGSVGAVARAFGVFGRVDRVRRHRQSALPVLFAAVLSR